MSLHSVIRKKRLRKTLLTRNALPDLAKMAKILEPGYKELVGEKYQKFRWSQFEKTGCLITADGSEDDKIAPEGLEDYTVPPPSILDPVLEPPQAVPPLWSGFPEKVRIRTFLSKVVWIWSGFCSKVRIFHKNNERTLKMPHFSVG